MCVVVHTGSEIQNDVTSLIKSVSGILLKLLFERSFKMKTIKQNVKGLLSSQSAFSKADALVGFDYMFILIPSALSAVIEVSRKGAEPPIYNTEHSSFCHMLVCAL